MVAARFSNDKMFYGPLSQEENRRQKKPIEPAEKEINLIWLRSWKINVPEDYPSRSDQFA